MPGRRFVMFLCALLAAAAACSSDEPSPTPAPGSATSTAVTSAASPTSTPAVLTRTEVRRYQPPARAATSVTGTCFSQSVAVVRPDAWRCSVGNQIHDPCFGAYNATRLICVPTPFDDSQAIELTLLRPACTDLTGGTLLCRPEALSPDNPPVPSAWAFETEAGDHCILKSSGTSAVVNGERLNYFCRDDMSGFIGKPAAGGIWTARRVRISDVGAPETWLTPVPETEVRLKTVWW